MPDHIALQIRAPLHDPAPPYDPNDAAAFAERGAQPHSGSAVASTANADAPPRYTPHRKQRVNMLGAIALTGGVSLLLGGAIGVGIGRSIGYRQGQLTPSTPPTNTSAATCADPGAQSACQSILSQYAALETRYNACEASLQTLQTAQATNQTGTI